MIVISNPYFSNSFYTLKRGATWYIYILHTHSPYTSTRIYMCINDSGIVRSNNDCSATNKCWWKHYFPGERNKPQVCIDKIRRRTIQQQRLGVQYVIKNIIMVWYVCFHKLIEQPGSESRISIHARDSCSDGPTSTCAESLSCGM